MPRLYLFRITHIPSKVGRRVAIITKADFDPELRVINPGTKTGYFDKDKRPNDGCDYKGSIEITQEIYDKIIEQLEKSGPNPAMMVANDGPKLLITINGMQMLIASYATKSRTFIEYPYVFIKE